MAYLSFIFLASCILVSIPTYFFPELAKVFGGTKPVNSPMRKEIRESSLYSVSEKNYSKQLSMKIDWLDNKTVIINFNRKIYKDEGIKVVLGELSNLKGVSLNEKITLKYGYDKYISE